MSKQILNYSYPPLLYQRGDDEDEDEDDLQQLPNDEEDEGMPDFGEDFDENEDKDIAELIKGSKGG